MRNAIRHVAMVGLLAGFAAPVFAADPQSIDWPKIPVKSVTLFYPGRVEHLRGHFVQRVHAEALCALSGPA
ncbi:MAG: hypothetical protein EXQ82_02435 [Pseudolabrys sp.]|nr:hypothetical protein [Pseudolabrys sp.]